ncbi:MAG: helix-turn-helix transcriptional regulator, partial [Clostridia bacterium]|nr:helix-turn-helix transcriptional regulator [Clostridia bacterium]
MIGDVIKANRIKNGWTQEQLADRLNVTKASVSKWELNQNSPDIGTLPALGDVF